MCLIEDAKVIRWFKYVLLVIFYIHVGACVAIGIDEQEDKRNYYPVEEVEIISDENGWDLPANEGIKNALLNVEQLANIKYTVLADFNKVSGYFNAGTTIKGLIYSSTRAEDLFVPNNVTLWTFMSALKNPNSYPYTVDITQAPYLIQGLAKPYYGLVCTSLIQYALGIKYNFQIHQMTVWDGFDEVYPQDIDKIRLADILTTERGHTRLITGIHREDGHVIEIEITEGVSPCVKKKVYPVQDVVETLEKEEYVFYRYRYIKDTDHTQSPFVCAGDETSDGTDVLKDLVVIPRRGDKSNWRKDEKVILDVIERSDYAYYKLEKDDQIIAKQPIPANNIINLGVMPYGAYRLSLTNDKKESSATSWLVADYNISVKAMGGRKAKVTFSSKNATPLWVTWRRPALINAKNNNMPLWTTVITDTDRAQGCVVTELDSYVVKKIGSGKWDLKVAFETEYGIISSDSETVIIH